MSWIPSSDDLDDLNHLRQRAVRVRQIAYGTIDSSALEDLDLFIARLEDQDGSSVLFDRTEPT